MQASRARMATVLESSPLADKFRVSMVHVHFVVIVNGGVSRRVDQTNQVLYPRLNSPECGLETASGKGVASE